MCFQYETKKIGLHTNTRVNNIHAIVFYLIISRPRNVKKRNSQFNTKHELGMRKSIQNTQGTIP